jgi:hypothetical protein
MRQEGPCSILLYQLHVGMDLRHTAAAPPIDCSGFWILDSSPEPGEGDTHGSVWL